MTRPTSGARSLEGAGAPVEWRVHLALFAVQLAFGGFHVVAKGLLASLHPLALAGLRVGLATPILLWEAWRHDRLLPARYELPRLALLGFLGVFLNQVLFVVGLKFTTATNAAILMPSIPVFAVALGALSGVEGVGPRRLLGIGLAVAGSLVLVDPTQFSLSPGSGLGNVLILLNCLSFSGFLVLQRSILARLPWRTVIAWSFAFGAAGILPLAAPHLAVVSLGALPPAVWWGVAYVVLIPTVLGYAVNTWAVQRSSPSLAASYTTLQPVLTAVLAALALGERTGWRDWAGCALIAAGLWRVSHRQPRRARAGSPR